MQEPGWHSGHSPTGTETPRPRMHIQEVEAQSTFQVTRVERKLYSVLLTLPLTVRISIPQSSSRQARRVRG